MCCRIQKLIMVGILTNGSLNASWYRSKLHSFCSHFLWFFNSYILPLNMQGSPAVKRTLHFAWRVMHAEDVLFRRADINVQGDRSDNTVKPFYTVITQHTVNVSKRVMDSTLLQCAFEYIHIILSLYISPPYWDIGKESMIYTKTLIIIHCMLINSEFLHLPCGRPCVLEMQPFQSS